MVRRAVAADESVPTTTKAQLFITMNYDQLSSRLTSTRDQDEGNLAAGTIPGI